MFKKTLLFLALFNFANAENAKNFLSTVTNVDMAERWQALKDNDKAFVADQLQQYLRGRDNAIAHLKAKSDYYPVFKNEENRELLKKLVDNWRSYNKSEALLSFDKNITESRQSIDAEIAQNSEKSKRKEYLKNQLESAKQAIIDIKEKISNTRDQSILSNLRKQEEQLQEEYQKLIDQRFAIANG